MTDDNKLDLKLPDTSKLLVSSSPHLHDGSSVKKIMYWVVLALLPGCAMGIYHYGIDAVRVLGVCVISCMFFEYIICRMLKRKHDWKDGSALVTGLLMGMILSANIPSWVCVIGCFIAILFGKQIYGGIGYNPFNPAIVGRIALQIGFPKLMTSWVPSRFMDKSQFIYDKATLSSSQIDAVKQMPHVPFFHNMDGITCATPLNTVKLAKSLGTATDKFMNTMSSWHNIWNYAIGNVGGCIGESSAIAIIIGGVLLIALKIIRWQVPVTYIGTVIIFSTIVHFTQSAPALPGPIFEIFTGGLMIGAFFMLTDMTTTPMTIKGSIICGVGCGIITSVIRDWGGYPEGVQFSILLMNACTPLIDRWTSKKPFGAKSNKKLEAQEA